MKKARRKICVLGVGNMGEALIKGMLSGGIYTKKEIIASDISGERLAYIRSSYGIETTKDSTEAAASSDYIIISVKPSAVKSLIEEISPFVDRSKAVISIVAGMPIHRIQRWFKKDMPIIRVMPNICILVMEGAAAIAPGPDVSDRDLKAVKRIFDAVGKSVILGEEYLNAVTGLSGSGPAYVFTMIEALADGGVKVGLPRGAATLLAAQTLLGGAKMVLETGKHPGGLKDMVTSPGGTTIEGIYRIEASGIRAALMKAVEDATKKAEELGKVE